MFLRPIIQQWSTTMPACPTEELQRLKRKMTGRILRNPTKRNLESASLVRKHTRSCMQSTTNTAGHACKTETRPLHVSCVRLNFTKSFFLEIHTKFHVLLEHNNVGGKLICYLLFVEQISGELLACLQLCHGGSLESLRSRAASGSVGVKATKCKVGQQWCAHALMCHPLA